MVMLQNDKLHLCHKLNLNRIIDNDGKEHHNFECTHDFWPMSSLTILFITISQQVV
jgi:hypothetical protein